MTGATATTRSTAPRAPIAAAAAVIGKQFFVAK